MRGVAAYRAARVKHPHRPGLDLYIVSAGFGVVRGAARLPAYDASFSSMSRSQARALSDELGIEIAVRRLLERSFELALVLLGEPYLDAVRYLADIDFGGHTVVLCGRRASLVLPRHPRLSTVVLDVPAARAFRCGHVGLKGEVAARILECLAEGRAAPGCAQDALNLPGLVAA